MGARPSDRRSAGSRKVGANLPPVPRPSTARPSASRSRPAGRAPLAARVDVLERPAVRAAVRDDSGRARRFVRRHGWRAYAIPFLTVATLFALVDLALNPPTPVPSRSAAATDALPPVVTPSAPAPTSAVVPSAAAEGDAGPTETPEPAAETTYVEQGAGSLTVVDGSSEVYGSGPLSRFIVETEDGIEVDRAAFAQAVTATLADPRSWGGGGRMSFQRVGAAEAAAGAFEFRVALVSPGSMERYCPGVGTGGYTSCRYGDRAVINLARWATAVPHYDGDIETYRHYVVNHEVGHALGNGHVDCPGPGAVAPVMLQQTLSLDGCVKNAWPYP